MLHIWTYYKVCYKEENEGESQIGCNRISTPFVSEGPLPQADCVQWTVVAETPIQIIDSLLTYTGV